LHEATRTAARSARHVTGRVLRVEKSAERKRAARVASVEFRLPRMMSAMPGAAGPGHAAQRQVASYWTANDASGWAARQLWSWRTCGHGCVHHQRSLDGRSGFGVAGAAGLGAGRAGRLARALCYGALARHIPESGGEYVFLSRTLHPALGYLAGWVSLVGGFAVPLGVLAYAFGQYIPPWEAPL